MKKELMSDHQQRVAEFNRRAGRVLPETPMIPNKDTLIRQLRLLWEELLELTEACGVRAEVHHDEGEFNISRQLSSDSILEFAYTSSPSDLVKIADGCADLSVVNLGLLCECGIADKPLLAEVDLNNLAKFGDGGYLDDKGKWHKPPGHKPPDIAGVISKQYACPPTRVYEIGTPTYGGRASILVAELALMPSNKEIMVRSTFFRDSHHHDGNKLVFELRCADRSDVVGLCSADKCWNSDWHQLVAIINDSAVPGYMKVNFIRWDRGTSRCPTVTIMTPDHKYAEVLLEEIFFCPGEEE